MEVWILLVRSCGNGINNISQEGYLTYKDAIKEIDYKLKDVDSKSLSDFMFKDLTNNIVYELKNVFIRKAK